MPKFIEAHRNQPFLLPPDLRDWMPEDDLAHFVVEAVERVPMESFVVNERGTGSAQYPPRLMLALLVYCYANGVFGSRRVERATYRDVGVRYLAANLHPDHDTICTFRRNNVDAIASAFEQVLLMAAGVEAVAGGDGERGRHEGGREREQAEQSALRPCDGVAGAVAGGDRGSVGGGGACGRQGRCRPGGLAGRVEASPAVEGEAGRGMRDDAGAACAEACGA